VKVFLSWSGTKSRLVANAMKVLLQDVNQRAIVWFSATDISAGERWGLQLATELEGTDYGIICVTRDSIRSPWTLFEAGALAKSVTSSRVCPYLIDARADQLPGPLAQFQAKRATKDETWELLQGINLAMGSDTLPEVRLHKYFESFWPDLEAVLSRVNSELQALPREMEEQLIEVLPRTFYRIREIEMIAQFAGLPIWEINLNQAALYVWRELIQLAASEKRLGELVDQAVREAPVLTEIFADLRDKLTPWSQPQ
jgi:TIR domain-containing protein/effector-associated domain 1 (EAD1)-containing protein